MVGLSFKRERVLKERGRESWRVLRVLFNESTAAIIIHKSSSSSLAFLSIYRGAEASGRVGWSWGIVLSPLCFTTFLFSLVWAPSGALHHSHGHEVLGGFPVMVTLLITLHLWILSSAAAGKSAVFLKSWCLAWPWNVNTISCLFFFLPSAVEGKGSNGLSRSDDLLLALLFVGQVDLFLLIPCLFQAGERRHDSDSLDQTKSLGLTVYF